MQSLMTFNGRFERPVPLITTRISINILNIVGILQFKSKDNSNIVMVCNYLTYSCGCKISADNNLKQDRQTKKNSKKFLFFELGRCLSLYNTMTTCYLCKKILANKNSILYVNNTRNLFDDITITYNRYLGGQMVQILIFVSCGCSYASIESSFVANKCPFECLYA